uniref:PH domain-containing protein n=1 Tax=Globisporangium ultimum (strain ATCC 200006 / CBS 805.95 / DAOM BR144) TaxID=431595 RepID=K3XC01_GLOUD
MADQQILRTGVLFKKGSGMGPFGRKNWKPRYFVLTPSKLKYFTFEDGDLKGEVDLSGCDDNMIEVMPMDAMKTGSSASTIWRVAINAPERRLLVAAGTEMEMNDWVDKLMLAFRINSGQAAFPAPSRSSFGSNGAPGSGPTLNQS